MSLCSKFWYREVWRWQSALSSNGSAASSSLAKRKNIIDANLHSISISAPSERSYGSQEGRFALDAFWNRFIAGSRATLRNLTFFDPGNGHGGGLSASRIAAIGSSLQSLEWRFTAPHYLGVSSDWWKREYWTDQFAPNCGFADSLTHLTISGVSYGWAAFDVIAIALPNLIELCLPHWARRNGDANGPVTNSSTSHNLWERLLG